MRWEGRNVLRVKKSSGSVTNSLDTAFSLVKVLEEGVRSMNFTQNTILAIFLLGGALTAPAQNSQLTLRQAIDVALHRNPEQQAAQADVAAATATWRLSRAELFPKLSFTEDISRGNDPVYAFGTKLRQRQFSQADFELNALNRPGPIGNFAARLSGQWQVFDSLHTQRTIRSAQQMRRSAASDAEAVDQKTIFAVVEAWESVLYAQRQVEVTRHEQETAATLLASAEDRVKAGLAVESDRMAAFANVAARKQEMIVAEGELDLAWAQLRMAVGDENLPQSELRSIEERALEAPSIDEELATALKKRPDLQAVERAQAAQRAATGAARSAFGPRVSAYGNWEEDRGSLSTAGGHNWLAGAQVTMDILPMGKRAAVDRECAAQRKVDAQKSSLQQTLRMQITQAHTHLRVASQSMEAAHAALDLALEGLRIVKNRYDAGLTNITDLLRAEDTERQSQANYWRAVYHNAVAYAENLFATGTLTPEATEALQ